MKPKIPITALLRTLESDTARSRGIESPRNTTFRVLKETVSPYINEKGREQEAGYLARQLMGDPRSPERLRAGLGGVRLPTEEIVNLVRWLSGNQKGKYFRLDENSHGYYEDASGNRVE